MYVAALRTRLQNISGYVIQKSELEQVRNV